MKKTRPANNLILFPDDQLFRYLRTGKFKALTSDWKHEPMPLLYDYELFVVTEGTLYLEYMGTRFTVNSGEYLIIPPSNSLREGFKKAYCAFYWIHFTADLGLFPALVPRSDLPCYEKAKCFLLPQSAPIPRVEKLVVLMKQLQDLGRNNYPAISLNAMTTAILTELYGQLSAEFEAATDPLESKQVYSDIADYIRRNISRNIKISEIADAFGYSPKYLSHLFSKTRGISLKQYILNTKIEVANFYLTDSDRSISEIAAEVGFSDVHNFSRTYRRITGLSPSDYRNTYAKRILFHI